jgi:hypothetical protein
VQRRDRFSIIISVDKPENVDELAAPVREARGLVRMGRSCTAIAAATGARAGL